MEVPGQLRDLFVQVGATFENGRIFLPRPLVEQAIQSAPKSFTLHGRDPARSIQMGGGSVHFGTGGLRCRPWIWTAGPIEPRHCMISMTSPTCSTNLPM